IPLEDPVKVIELRLQNKTDKLRSLSVTYYAEWVLGVRREANSPFIVTEWDDSSYSLLARNTFQETFRDATAFLHVNQYAETSALLPSNLSWTADRQEFLGRNGIYESPDVMNRQSLSG